VKPSLRAQDVATEEVSMNGPDDQAAARLRRQRLIERLNAKENELSKSQGERLQLSNKEFEIEMERQRNPSRRGFSQII
jgi:hypothetical protein